MNDEIINFYSERKIPLSLMIDKRKHPLTQEQVEESAVHTYNKIKDGLLLDNREIPRYIYRHAHKVKGEVYKEERLKNHCRIEELNKDRVFLALLLCVSFLFNILRIWL